MARSHSRAWLASALIASGLIVAAAPWLGQLRAIGRTAAGEWFAPLMAAGVAGAVTGVVAIAAFRIRRDRRRRYAALAAAVVIALAYGAAMRTGIPEVDAVESVHFLEYGLLTTLFYLGWRAAGDLAMVVLPMLAALIVGLGDEWLQWFVPARVGEVRDVALNLGAIVSGLLFALAIAPPGRLRVMLSPASARQVRWLGAAAVVATGAFLHAVHLGHEIADEHAGVFRSRYRADTLTTISEARAHTWAVEPPLTWSRWSREDQYFSEGIAHVQRRNQAWQEGNLPAARHENLILETYYAPVLDAPSYLGPGGHRWPASQRAQAESSGGRAFFIYVSDALPYPILAWSPRALWGVAAVAVAAILRSGRPRRAPPPNARDAAADVRE